ncbi:response regulator [bacterium]|nr:response regulator [bacterium]NIN92087.1 response regulator [bacterium]NIO18300.1 response regulator [bacterium]NIO72936.1 response regulator [bacterium]
MPKREILIVEDNPQTVKLLKFILEKNNYSTVSAKDGEQGLQKVKEKKPDLIILDLMLPGMDGYRVCETLKSDPDTKEIPVLVLTALDTGADFEKALEKKADWYITKPFEPEHLLKRIDYLIEKRKEDEKK